MTDNKISLEEAMAMLEAVVARMENEKLPLEESLKLFREGTELVQTCTKLLDDAQMQIKKVMAAADGSPVMEDFIDE